MKYSEEYQKLQMQETKAKQQNEKVCQGQQGLQQQKKKQKQPVEIQDEKIIQIVKIEQEKTTVKQKSDIEESEKSVEIEQPVQSPESILQKLIQANLTVINDISAKKGRKQKFTYHMHKLQNMLDDHIEVFYPEDKSKIYEKFSILYYNLAKLGQNEVALQNAIIHLQLSQRNRYLVVRWKMQLAAMKSSTSHKDSLKAAVQAMEKITQIIQDLSKNLTKSSPKLCYFLSLVLKVINSERKNDFIWVHNVQNNFKCFTDHIRQLMMTSQDFTKQSSLNSQQLQGQLPLNSDNNLKFQPFFPDYDFQIADYMSLEMLNIDYIEQQNKQTQITEISRQIVIYASICCFTQATESYYMRDYSLKYLHFKAIEIALLAVDRNCTYIGFLLKVLNDYYGTKMTQIRQENSEFMEINELRRRIPRDKRQVKMKNICFAE